MAPRMADPNRPDVHVQPSAGSTDWQHFTRHHRFFSHPFPLLYPVVVVQLEHPQVSQRPQRLPIVFFSIARTSRFPPPDVHRMFRRLGLGTPRLPARNR